jgi:uncharacterized protein YmfQ (DUF2313 family)
MPIDATAYSRQLMALLPPGVVWNLEATSKLSAFFTALAQELARVDARAAALINESDPRTVSELLPEWEAMLGLPDPCVSVDQTTAERLRGVLAKYIAQGGQSLAYFIAVAAALGYTVTLTEYRQSTVEDDCETPCYGVAWAYAWQANAPLNTVNEMTVNDDVEQPFAWWANQALECVLGRLKPSHTTLIFAYS